MVAGLGLDVGLGLGLASLLGGGDDGTIDIDAPG